MGNVSRSFKFFLILSTIFFLFLGCHSVKKNRPSQINDYNVVLITLDTLRADHLGCYGHKKIETPNIDKIAREGITFVNAYTPVPVTLPSHTSIFTGLYPLYHGVRNNGTFKANDELETLTEILKRNNYQTAAFIGAFVLDSRYGLDQGFDYYDDYLKKDPNAMLMMYNERSAEEVINSASKWVEQKGENPFFLWLHCFDPHAPYEPPAPFHTNYQGRLYQGEIAYVDWALGGFFSLLREKDLLEKTLIIITSDHGEGLGEHAEKTHAIFIYDSTLHVPLIMRFPGKNFANLKVSENASIIDIMPTILDFLHINRPSQSSFHGISLMDTIGENKKPLKREILCETYYPYYNHNWSPLEGLRTDKWKFIKAPRSELYDLENDPRESDNLFSGKPKVVKQLEERMNQLQKKSVSEFETTSAHLVMDQDTRERLKSLGYIWTSSVTSTPKPYSLPDPKDMITTLDYLNMGTYFYTLGDYERAVNQFKLMLKVNPKDVFTHFVLGYIYDKLDKTDLAIQELQEAINLDPTYVNAYNNLGTVYNRLGKIDKALEVFTIALELNPDYVELQDNLGVVYYTLKEYPKALERFQKAIELNPKRSETYNNIGSVYLAMGKSGEAEKAVLKALMLNPGFLEARNNLGSIYLTKKEYNKAEKEFKKLLAIDPNYVESWVNLATCYLNSDKIHLAKEALEKAISINPKVPTIYNCLGTLYVQEGNLKAAEENFQKSIVLDPNSSEIYYNLGIAYYNSGKIDQAISEYKHAIELDPVNSSAHINLGIAYFTKGLLDLSIAEYQKALQIDPNNLEAHINLGVIFYNKGLYDEALKEYQKAAAIDPNNIQSYINMGLTYAAKGMIQEAVYQYTRALDFDPLNLEAHINLASVFFKQGKYDFALEEYLRIVQIDTQNPAGYYGLGYAYFFQGFLNQAVIALQKALFIKPDYVEARLLLDRIKAIKGP